MNLANFISLFRIIIIPAFVILLLNHKPHLPFLLFSFAIVTDGLDGMVARFQKQKTKSGSLLDPLADKLLLASAYITLTSMKLVPLWVVVVVFSRDLILIIGWLIVYFSTGISTVIPTILGKATAVLQMAVVFSVLLFCSGYLTEGKWLAIKPLILSVMVLFTVISGMEYSIRGIWLISRETA
ncbi:CDP-alcohol phosphatidyltransferase family protein [bacterium]|nr:CDP-alcohol phosphatidyltransferase family protein [bacterium]